MTIYVATWNVALLCKPDCLGNKIESPKIRLPRIISRIKEHSQIDVWMFNEVFFYKNKLIQALKNEYPYYIDLGYKYPGLSSGLLTMSKYPLTDVRKEFYSDRYGWDYFTNKGILTAKVNTGLYSCYVVNTHMQQGDTEKNNQARLGQVTQLADHVRELFPERVVLGGDLNMSPNPKYGRDLQYNTLVSLTGLEEPEYINVNGKTAIVRFLTKNLNKDYIQVLRKTDGKWYYSDTGIYIVII